MREMGCRRRGTSRRRVAETRARERDGKTSSSGPQLCIDALTNIVMWSLRPRPRHRSCSCCRRGRCAVERTSSRRRLEHVLLEALATRAVSAMYAKHRRYAMAPMTAAAQQARRHDEKSLPRQGTPAAPGGSPAPRKSGGIWRRLGQRRRGGRQRPPRRRRRRRRCGSSPLRARDRGTWLGDFTAPRRVIAASASRRSRPP